MKWWQYTIILIMIIYGGKIINLIISTIVGKEKYKEFREIHEFGLKTTGISISIIGLLAMGIILFMK